MARDSVTTTDMKLTSCVRPDLLEVSYANLRFTHYSHGDTVFNNSHYTQFIDKGKFIPVALSEGVLGSGGIAPRILGLGTRCR
jgi:hypothetical protein